MKGGKLVDGLVEGDGQPSGGVIVAEQDVGEGGAAGLAGIPGSTMAGTRSRAQFHGERAAVEQHQDARFSEGHDLPAADLPARGASPMSTRSPPWNPSTWTRHIFTLQARGETQDQDHRVGLAGGGDALPGKRVAPLGRDQTNRISGVAQELVVVEADGIALARFEFHGRGAVCPLVDAGEADAIGLPSR